LSGEASCNLKLGRERGEEEEEGKGESRQNGREERRGERGGIEHKQTTQDNTPRTLCQ
jgi:hypothetical protein